MRIAISILLLLAARPSRAQSQFDFLNQNLEGRYSTVAADTVRTPQAKSAPQNPPVANGMMQGTLLLHSGELVTSTIDLDAGGRNGWNVVIDRTYRSGTMGGESLMGAGWSSSIFRRLRPMPVGDVEYRDGSGEIHTFVRNDLASMTYQSPKGLFLRLVATEDGWGITDEKGQYTEFDKYGRIKSDSDQFWTPRDRDSGNRIHYLYGANGRLERIVDPLGRVTTVSWYDNDAPSPGAMPGGLREITDWRGRSVTYRYDAPSQTLREVRLPEVRLGDVVSRPTIRYAYLPTTNFTDRVELTNLVSITDPNEVASNGPPRVRFRYGIDGFERDRLLAEEWATGEKVTITYPGPTTVEVVDALGQRRVYTITGVGPEAHISKVVERAVEVTAAGFGRLALAGSSAMAAAPQDRSMTFEYEPTGQLRRSTLEGVRVTDYTYRSTPFGSVVASQKVSPHATQTSSASNVGSLAIATEPITRRFHYDQSVPHFYLQGVSSNDIRIDSPEPHRDLLAPQSLIDSVQSKTKLDLHGRATEYETSGGTAAGAGSRTNVEYHAETNASHIRGTVRRITDGDLVTRFDYPTPLQTIVTDPRGIVTTTDTDTWLRPTRIVTTGPGLTFEENYTYDTTGNLTRRSRRQDEKTVVNTSTYDVLGRKTSTTTDNIASPSGNARTTIAYDIPSRKIVMTLPGGASITRELDSLGRTRREVTATGSSPIEMRYSCDLDDNLVAATDGLVSESKAFDAHGRETMTRAADGTIASQNYDAWDNPTTAKVASTSGAVVSESTFAFTPNGRLTALKQKIDETQTRDVKLAWDGAGRVNRIENSGRTAHTDFDLSGRALRSVSGEGSLSAVTTEFLRNEFSAHAGTLPQLVQPTEKYAAPVTSTEQHDTAGNVVHAETGNLRFEQKFDQGGNATEVKHPNRPATTMSYDGRGALREEKLPDATTHQYRYSENAVLDAYIDPALEPGVKVESDLSGRHLRRIYADQTVEILTWSGRRIDTFTDRQGRGRRFIFNTKGQLERIDAVAGATLEKLEYDDAGRLVTWTNAHARMTFADFDLEGRARKTSTTIFSDGSGLTTATGGIEYSQTHGYNVHGERSEWTTPRTATFQTVEPWTDVIRQRYDAMGNVVAIDRKLFGATEFKPLLTADYRNTGRPVARNVATECGAGGAPSVIRREYRYSDSTLQQSAMSVSVAADSNVPGATVAGSALTYNGLQIAKTQLLGVSSGERSSEFAYDTRSRVKEVVAGRKTEEKLSPADFRNEATRQPRIPQNVRADLQSRGVNVNAIDPPSLIATEAPGHKVQSITRGAVTRPFTYSGAERTGDGRFLYEWDIFGRLVRATEAGNPATRMRVSYGYDPNGRMVTRKVEMAQNGAPNDWIPPTPNLITDALPAETHFLWDPITDTIAAVVDPTSGTLARQIIHAENTYDDPIEVTLRTEERRQPAVVERGLPALVSHPPATAANARSAPAAVNNANTLAASSLPLPQNSPLPLSRLYPIFDEAATGNLQAVLNQRGEVVSRAMIGDAYGDDRSTLTGAAIDRIRMTAKKDQSGSLETVRIEFHSTERVDPSTVANGARLRARASDATNIALTNLPTPRVNAADPFTIELEFTRAQWETLATTQGLTTIHPAITNTLRSTSFGPEIPYLPPPDWIPLTQTVLTTADAPIKARTSLAYLSQWLASIPSSTDRTLTLYEVTDLALLGTRGESDDPARFLLSSPLHALPFTDSVTKLTLARARWLDHETGTFLSPDPMGFVDSANVYAFAAGDPVNRRDPIGARSDLSADRRSMQARRDLESAKRRRTDDAHAMAAAEQLHRAGIARMIELRRRGARVRAGDIVAYSEDHQIGITTSGALIPNPHAGTIQAQDIEILITATGLKVAAPALSTAFRQGGGRAVAPLLVDEFIGTVVGVNPGVAATTARAVTNALEAQRAIANLTRQVNSELATNPALARNVLSRAEYEAGVASSRIAAAQYGNAVERMVAARIRQDPTLANVFRRVGGPNNPDFVAFGRNFDVTTETHAQVLRHMKRPRYGDELIVVTYERPTTFSAFPSGQ